jgi:LPXTG-motif cell wall-anchored protein
VKQALAALVSIAALGLGAGTGSASAAPAPSPNVTAYDGHGRRLPPDPRLHPGDTVLLVVTGFAAAANVQVRLAGTSVAHDVVADGSGTVHDVYVVPLALPDAQYTVTFVGPGPADPASISGRPHVAISNDDGVIVTVPNGGFFPFLIGNPRPTGSTSPTATVSASSTRRSPRVLPNTGTDILTPLVIAAVALLAGAAAIRLGRRAAHE